MNDYAISTIVVGVCFCVYWFCQAFGPYYRDRTEEDDDDLDT